MYAVESPHRQLFVRVFECASTVQPQVALPYAFSLQCIDGWCLPLQSTVMSLMLCVGSPMYHTNALRPQTSFITLDGHTVCEIPNGEAETNENVERRHD